MKVKADRDEASPYAAMLAAQVNPLNLNVIFSIPHLGSTLVIIIYNPKSVHVVEH